MGFIYVYFIFDRDIENSDSDDFKVYYGVEDGEIYISEIRTESGHNIIDLLTEDELNDIYKVFHKEYLEYVEEMKDDVISSFYETD